MAVIVHPCVVGATVCTFSFLPIPVVVIAHPCVAVSSLSTAYDSVFTSVVIIYPCVVGTTFGIAHACVLGVVGTACAYVVAAVAVLTLVVVRAHPCVAAAADNG